MKKLKLQALKLGAKEVLSRDQLKEIIGGWGSEPGPPGGGVFCASCESSSFYPGDYNVVCITVSPGWTCQSFTGGGGIAMTCMNPDTLEFRGVECPS